LGKHRLHRTEHCQGQRGQRLLASSLSDLRHVPDATVEHHGSPDRRHRHVGCRRQGFRHDSLERSLANLASDQPEEKSLLGLSGGGEDLTGNAAADSVRAGASRRRQPIEGAAHVLQLE
jgi:hypothetical protein